MSLRKRARFTEPRFFRGPKRQVEKIQTIYSATTVGTNQTDLTLMTVVDPVTVGGFIWEFDSSSQVDPAAGPGLSTWAIVINREGVTVGTLGIASGSAPYQPEENVIVAGCINVGEAAPATLTVIKTKGRSKTMRKLKGGDTVHMIQRGFVGTQSVTTCGVITYFAKH